MAFNAMRYRIPILKRAIPSLKKRLTRFSSKRGFLLKRSHGGLFLLNYRNFVDRQIAFYDDYEERQIQALLAAMRNHPCDVFIDVGANIGFYSVLVGRSNLARRVIAFEPDDRNSLQLGANILINQLVGKVTVVSKPVTSSSGPVGFQRSPDRSTGQSHIGAPDGAIQLAGVALDDVVADKNSTIFIKMDIEGHELEAVKGMSRLLSNNKVFLQVESFGARAHELTGALSAAGLSVRGAIGDDHYFSNF